MISMTIRIFALSAGLTLACSNSLQAQQSIIIQPGTSVTVQMNTLTQVSCLASSGGGSSGLLKSCHCEYLASFQDIYDSNGKIISSRRIGEAHESGEKCLDYIAKAAICR